MNTKSENGLYIGIASGIFFSFGAVIGFTEGSYWCIIINDSLFE